MMRNTNTLRLFAVVSLLFSVSSGGWAQSPSVLYTWEGTGDTLNWSKNFGTNDVSLSNATSGKLTITETGVGSDAGKGVAISDSFNTIKESAASLNAGGIDLTGLEELQLDLGHSGVGNVDVQFFAQVTPASSFVALSGDVPVAPGIATYPVPLTGLNADQIAYIRTIGINIRDHDAEGNLVWTLEEVRSAGTPLKFRDFATHNPGSSDSGLEGAIVNFDNAAIQGNDGGQNQTGLSNNLTATPPGNSGSLQWIDLAAQGGGAVSYANGTAFGGNTFNERPTDMTNYNFVKVRMAATLPGGGGGSLDVQYFLQTGAGFSFQGAGNASLPIDGQFHELLFPIKGLNDLDLVMQHGVNLGDHPEDLVIDIDNVRAVVPEPSTALLGCMALALLMLPGNWLARGQRG